MTSEYTAKILLLISLAVTTLLAIILLIVSSVDISVLFKSVIWLRIFDAMTLNLLNSVGVLGGSGVGWYGGFAKHRCTLLTCAIICIVDTLLLTINLGALNVIHNETNKTIIIDNLDTKYKAYETDSEVRKSIDTMQRYFECCGSGNPLKVNGSYTASCCKSPAGGNCTEVFGRSCADAIRKCTRLRIYTEALIGIFLLNTCIAVTITAFIFRQHIPKNRNPPTE